MRPHEIENTISGFLDGDAHELWIGQRREDRNEYVCRVQRAGNEYEDENPGGAYRDLAERNECQQIANEFFAEAANV